MRVLLVCAGKVKLFTTNKNKKQHSRGNPYLVVGNVGESTLIRNWLQKHASSPRSALAPKKHQQYKENNNSIFTHYHSHPTKEEANNLLQSLLMQIRIYHIFRQCARDRLADQ
jgi:hypothetical protein